jgi:hypothetical protein
MRRIVAAAFVIALLVPAVPGFALNPQPEPPGRSKIKRIYTKEDDSRRKQQDLRKTKTQQKTPSVPAKTK